MRIYAIPGLGYDCRIFKKLAFTGYKVECLNWIEPRKHEVIGEYALRLFHDLPEEEEIVLIGHSFGGIIAQEIAAKRNISKIILISSVRSRAEIPTFFKLVKPLGLYRLFTKALSIKTIRYWGANHGFVGEVEQALFKSMVGKHSNDSLQWALKALSEWESPGLPASTSIFQMHGTNDKTFPVELIKRPDLVLKEASHVMVYAEPEKVSGIIIKELEVGGVF